MQGLQDKDDNKQEAAEDIDNRVKSPHYDGPMVDRALKMALGRTKNRKCNNMKNNLPTTCTCLGDIVDGLIYEDGELEKDLAYALSCWEMSECYNFFSRCDNKELRHNLATRVWNMPIRNGESHLGVVDLIWEGTTSKEEDTEDADVQEFEEAGSTGLQSFENGIDWEIDILKQRSHYYTTMCFSTTLLVWEMLVDRENLDSWRKCGYKDILKKAGVDADNVQHQKTRQRLFYSRIADYMKAARDAKQISFKECKDTFKANGWRLAGRKNESFSRMWYTWKLGIIHVLRADSDLEYDGGKTKLLVEKIGIQMTQIQQDTMRFLKELFLIMRRDHDKKFSRVSVDKKLLFLQFKEGTSIRKSLDVFYMKGMGTKRSKKMNEFMGRTDYQSRLDRADAEILAALRSATGCTGDIAYQISLIHSEVHHPQEPHIDYKPILGVEKKYYVGFLPLTNTGQFLEMWEGRKDDDIKQEIEGQLVFIPEGLFVVVRGDTIHAGGYRAEHRTDSDKAHLRLHFYVYPGATRVPIDTHHNKYVDTQSELYVHNKNLWPVGHVRNDAYSITHMFFHGLD